MKLTDSIQFASIAKAKELLTTEDLFTQSWSVFDIDSRVGKPNSNKEQLLNHISAQALEWTPEEQELLKNIVASINTNIEEQDFHLPLPNYIYLIKSTMKEEGGAMGYTRGSYIVLNEAISKMEEAVLKKLITHELFHVLTRNSPDFRANMYDLIGFQLMPPTTYPETLKELRITNPDCPQTDSYIILEVEEEEVACMMLLYAKSAFDGGRFFNYLKSGFLELNDHLDIAYKDGSPIIHDVGEVANFYEQVGRNTSYIIHPEEILADNFAFTVLGKEDLKDEWLIREMTNILQK